MRDLPDKILKITAGRYFFVPLTTFLSSDLHFMISKSTLKLTTYVTGGGTFKAVDIIAKYSEAWHILKIGYIFASIIGLAISSDLIYRNIFIKLLPTHTKTDELLEIRPPPYPFDEDKLQMIVGLKHERLTAEKVSSPIWMIVEEKGMYQNFLITGTIGTGKTASAMYPFLKQAMFYKVTIPC